MPRSPYEETLQQEADNPYRQTLREQSQAAETSLRVSAKGASTVAPDRKAETLKLSAQTGLPASVIERNFESIQKRSLVANTDYSKMLEEAPALAAYLDNPDNAALSQDDHEPLGTIERILNYPRALFSGIYRTVPGLLGLLETASRVPIPSETPYMGEIDYERLLRTGMHSEVSDFLEDRRRLTEAAYETIRGERRVGRVEGAVLSGVESVGQVLSLAPLGGAALLGTLGASTAGETATRAADQGLPPSVALAIGSVDGAVEVATEFLPVGLLMKQIQGAPFLKTLMQELASEIPGEQVATLLQDLNAWAFLPENDKKTFQDYLNERPGAAYDTLVATLVGTLGQGGIARAASALSKKPLEQQYFEELGKAAEASKTRERLPAKLEELVRGITAGQPTDTVYAPIDTFRTYFQEQQIDPRQVAAELGVAADYDQAVATRADLPIPMAAYAAKLAPTSHNAFFSKELRLSPDGMNAREVEELAKESEESEGKSEESEGNFAASAAKVREDIAGQLQGLGMTPETIAAYSRLYEAAFGTIGKRAGVDPFSLYEPYRLTITRPIPEILRSLPNIDVALDPLLDRLRSGTLPTQTEMFGPALLEFLIEKGGVRDEGGELAALEVDAERKPFAKHLIQKEGLPLDTAREMAAEAGYLDPQSSIADFLDVIEKEVRGEPVFAQGRENPQVIEQNVILEQLQEYLRSRDVDLQTATNAEIKQLLQQAAEQPEGDGQVLEQAMSIEALAAEIDVAYESGNLVGVEEKEVRLEAMLAELNDQLEGTDEADDREGDGVSIEEQLARAWVEMQAPTGGMDRAEWLGNMRAAIEEAQLGGMTPGGLRADVSDEEILAAAKDAYDRQRQLRERSREAGRGELERVREFLQQRGVDTSYFQGQAAPDLTEYLKQVRQRGGETAVQLVNKIITDVKRRGDHWQLLLEATPDIDHEPLRQTLAAQRRTFEQQLGSDKRGTIRFGADRQFTIELLEKADLSTFLHESGHFYLELFGDVVEQLRAQDPTSLNETQQQMIADYQTALGWLGVESRDKIGTEQHEQWARGFEVYLREGKTPNPELRSIFARFRAWLVNIYRSLAQLRVTLTPEVTAVMDRLLATEEQIARAEQESGILALIEDQGQAERLGLSREEFALYRKDVQAASDAAKQKLQSEFMEEYERYSQEWWNARRAEMRETVAAELYEQRDVIALYFLQKGTLPDGSPLPEGIQGVKLDARDLETRYGKASRKPGQGSTVMNRLLELRVYAREKGVPADQVADLLGYSSGDELVQALVKMRDPQQLIEAETDRRMEETYGNMLFDGTAGQKAVDAVMTTGRSQVIEAEMQALAKKVRETQPFVDLGARRERRTDRQTRQEGIHNLFTFIPTVSLARSVAEARIASMRVRDIKPGLYLSAARREGLKAIEATNKGDFTAALTAKQKELINVEMYRAAREAQQEVEKIREYMRSFDDPKKRGRIGKAGADYLDQIDALRERFDFGRLSLKQIDRRQSLSEWIAGQQAQGLPVELPAELLNEAHRENYQELSVEFLQGLRDSIQMIEHFARLKNKLLQAKDQRELDATVEAMTASINNNAKGPPQKRFEVRLPQDRAARLASTFFASHRKLNSFFRELDGFQDGGPMWESVMRPINEATDTEALRIQQANQEIAALFDAHYQGQEGTLYQKTFIPELNGSLSKMGRVMVALNWGNADNRQRVLSGGLGDSGPINELQVQAILNALDARDWDFVDAMWRTIDQYWPEIAAKQKRVTGVAPEKVDALPFVNQFGRVMRGGYFPIKYEGQVSFRASSNLEADFADTIRQSAYGHTTTKRGHTKERLQNVKQPIRLDFGVITEHVQQVIHDLTHHEMLIDVARLLSDKHVQRSIYDFYGSDVEYKQIQGAIRDIAWGSQPSPDWIRPLDALRRGVVTASLGWNLLTSTLQPIGMVNGAVRIGAKWFWHGAYRWARNAVSMESTTRWIHERSDFMRSRGDNYLREMSELRNKIGLDRGRVSGWISDSLAKLGVDPSRMPAIADSYFYLIMRAQSLADYPTWLGAYEKAMADPRNDENRAVELADQAVIDSQGSGHIKDLSAVERQPVLKLLTTFYSYPNVVFNQTIEAVKARRVIDAAVLLAIVPMIEFAVREAIGGDGDDDAEELLAKLARHEIAGAFGYLMGLRELGGVIQGYPWQGPAGMRYVATFGKAITQALQGEPDAAFWRALNESTGIVFQYPALQVQRTLEGIIALAEGRTSNPLALLSGAPRP